jgi:hypothetical protein
MYGRHGTIVRSIALAAALFSAPVASAEAPPRKTVAKPQGADATPNLANIPEFRGGRPGRGALPLPAPPQGRRAAPPLPAEATNQVRRALAAALGVDVARLPRASRARSLAAAGNSVQITPRQPSIPDVVWTTFGSPDLLVQPWQVYWVGQPSGRQRWFGLEMFREEGGAGATRAFIFDCAFDLPAGPTTLAVKVISHNGWGGAYAVEERTMPIVRTGQNAGRAVVPAIFDTASHSSFAVVFSLPEGATSTYWHGCDVTRLQ